MPKKRRRINGLLLFGILAIVLLVVNYRPPIATIHCNEEILASKPDVIMLGAWWCTFCYQARKYFSRNNISYCEYDIEYSAEGKRLYSEMQGAGIPVLFIGKYRLSGFDEDSIEEALAELHAS